MIVYEADRIALIEASNRLAKAIKASKPIEITEPLTHKGKTLYHVNRERANTVKMTVNY